MAEQQNPPIFDLPKVTAVGIASPTAGILTSSFGVAGTLIGMALTAVIVTVLVDFLKAYLARAPGAVTSIPGGFRKRPPWRNALTKLKLPFSKFFSLPSARRRSILIGSLGASLISFLIGISIVTGVELGVGKSLSCWVWEECPRESSAADGATPRTSTLGSVYDSLNRSAPVEQPPPPGAKQGAPPQQEPTPGPDQPVWPRPGQQEESPSGVPQDQQGTPIPAEEEWPRSEDDRSANERNEGG